VLSLPNGSSRKSANCYSGVGDGGAGDANAPPKVLICQKLGKIPENFGKTSENLGKIPENLGLNP